jgi:hypothetical protein
MKTEEIEDLEGYIKTENEYQNGYVFNMLCEVLRQNQVENPKIPLRLFSIAEPIFTEHHEHPLKAIQLYAVELDKKKLNLNQRLFVME